MTIAHRQLHRRVWIVLSVLLPLLVLAGLLARRPIPAMMTRDPGPASGHAPNPPLP